MFCWPRISIYLCNKKQLVAALFTFSSFHKSASTCFGHICCPSSGGILYSIPPDDGLQICPKHVEANWRNELRIKIAASSWLSLHGWRIRCAPIFMHRIRLKCYCFLFAIADPARYWSPPFDCVTQLTCVIQWTDTQLPVLFVTGEVQTNHIAGVPEWRCARWRKKYQEIFWLKFLSAKFNFLKYGCKEPNADSNSYFGSCKLSRRYCKWPHRGDARPLWSLFTGKRMAFLSSAYILRYSVINLIFVQLPAIDLPYRVIIRHCPASKQWESFFIAAPCILFFFQLIHQQMHICYIYWTVHHCDSWTIRDQLDVTSY